mmetsp:Transcript_34966/g.68836  ORF Transcript_34966/g.68836 Transcript_34966/m.68836 type:complete len:343 (+) Transcript_34966:374-1402(+)
MARKEDACYHKNAPIRQKKKKNLRNLSYGRTLPPPEYDGEVKTVHHARVARRRCCLHVRLPQFAVHCGADVPVHFTADVVDSDAAPAPRSGPVRAAPVPRIPVVHGTTPRQNPVHHDEFRIHVFVRRRPPRHVPVVVVVEELAVGAGLGSFVFAEFEAVAAPPVAPLHIFDWPQLPVHVVQRDPHCHHPQPVFVRGLRGVNGTCTIPGGLLEHKVPAVAVKGELAGGGGLQPRLVLDDAHGRPAGEAGHVLAELRRENEPLEDGRRLPAVHDLERPHISVVSREAQRFGHLPALCIGPTGHGGFYHSARFVREAAAALSLSPVIVPPDEPLEAVAEILHEGR